MADGSKKEKSKRGGIATLSDLNRRNAADSDSDSDAQEYYTGGEKSGMMVQDPQGGRKQVDSIFDRAKQHGAQEPSVDTRRSAASSSAAVAFTGTARTVSGAAPQQQQQQPVRDQTQPPEPIFHTITFWRNGFTVDDGPLRGLSDPANLPLLKSIRDGECPPELEPPNRDIPVHVNLVRRDEDWQPPKEPKYKAFQGAGRTLGSSSSSSPQQPQQEATTTTTTTREAVRGVVVDEQQPFTSVQLRLADGTRMVARFNYSHTVAHIRDFINAARADGPKSYTLQAMGFPPKELSDLSQTIEGAGLLNAVVIQKLS